MVSACRPNHSQLERASKSIAQKLFFWFGGTLGQPQEQNFPSPWAIKLALRLDCSTAALTTPQKVLPIWKLVELKMLDFSDRTRTGISILTSAADHSETCIAWFLLLINCEVVFGRVVSKIFLFFCGRPPYQPDYRPSPPSSPARPDYRPGTGADSGDPNRPNVTTSPMDLKDYEAPLGGNAQLKCQIVGKSILFKDSICNF